MTATIGNYQEAMNTLFNQGLFEESAVQKQRLGTIRVLDDGRKYVYCQATAAAIAAGICVSKAVAPQSCTVAALDAAQNLVGVKEIFLTLTGTPTLNLYRDGWLVYTAGTGIGEMCKIRGNTVDDVPATGRCTFYLYDALGTTMVAASTTVDLFACPYDGVLINPAVADGDATTGERVLGVTLRTITASYYFWAQTKGLASVLLDVAAAAGAEADERFLIPGITEGTLTLSAAGAEPDQPRLGYTIETADITNAEASLVMLDIN